MALITWLSKNKPTIKSYVFGDEFLAMKTIMKALHGIRHKTRIMGVSLTGTSYIYGDNMSVIHNTKRTVSTLKKENNSICYHEMW